MTGKLSNKFEYASSFVERYCGFPLSSADGLNDLFEAVYKELSREEELDASLRDVWGNWDWQFSERQLKGELYVPTLDKLIAERVSSIDEASARRSAEPKWPNGKSFAIMLSHDVDIVSDVMLSFSSVQQRIRNLLAGRECWPAIRHGLSFLKHSTKRLAGGMTEDPLWHYEDWIKIEQKYGFKSTFYFFPSIILNPSRYDCSYKFSDRIVFDRRRMDVRSMIRELHSADWDVGLHGSYHSATDEPIFRHEKNQLEEVIGAPVRSTRQHYLHYDINITPGIHHRSGITNDSSHGFNRTVGFRSGTSYPYYCWDHQTGTPTNVLEIPQHVMDVALFSPCALEYNSALAIRHIIQMMDQIESVNGCLCVSWHPNYINDPKYWDVYAAVLSEAARRNAWGCSAKQLEEWWRLRKPCKIDRHTI